MHWRRHATRSILSMGHRDSVSSERRALPYLSDSGGRVSHRRMSPVDQSLRSGDGIVDLVADLKDLLFTV